MNASLARALDGVSVVALAANIPGPLAAARLRELGARVCKIEPRAGDPLALASPAWYAAIHQGVDVVALDLRDAGDRVQLHERLDRADLLVTAMRASALDRLELDWPRLHARWPKLCHVAVSGEAPPHDSRAGHDLTYQARAGLLSPPHLPRTVLADMAAAERAVWSALAALLERARSGSGVRAGVAIVDAAQAFAEPLRYGLTAPEGVLGGALPAYRLYAAADGWVALAALEAHFLERLAEMLGLSRVDEAQLTAAFRTREAAEWERLAERFDVPLAAVRA